MMYIEKKWNNMEYQEYTMPKITNRLIELPASIAKSEYDWEIEKIELETLEADLINEIDNTIYKNAEMRQAFINSNAGYLIQAKKVVKLRVEYHKLINEKDCLFEIARNKRAEMKSQIDSIKE